MRKKRAILYIRVSTDDQKIHGYSVPEQNDVLVKHCSRSDIDVDITFEDDFTGKTFDRPDFNKLMDYAKKNRGKIDYLFVKNWSRFGRNVTDALAVIKKLRDLGIEVQAVEQPLDFSVPESKIMLVIYLTTPEVDNDRRSLATFAAMRQARIDGYWMTSAPKGYRNARDESKKSVLEVHEKFGPLVIMAFEEMAKGIYTQEEIRRNLNRQYGFNCSRNNFSLMLRHPVYMGMIPVPAYKDEPAKLSKGRHAALITEELFYLVQDILEGRRKSLPTKYTAMPEFPLRGFLKCRQCGGNLTASKTLGCRGKKHYFYYHCQKGCPERISADDAHTAFSKRLKKIQANSEAMELFFDMLKDVYKAIDKETTLRIQNHEAEIKKNQERITNAQRLLLDGEIESGDYHAIKERYEKSIRELTMDISEIRLAEDKSEHYLRECIDVLKNIDRYWHEADIVVRQQIVSCIFPEKLIYEDETYRTPKVNEVVRLISLTAKELEENKKGASEDYSACSRMVARRGIEPLFPG